MEKASYVDHLELAGLTKDQAALYQTLVQKGPLTATKATREAGIARTLGYVILKQLETLGLVTKRDEAGSVSVFSATHPLKLQELVREQQRRAENARTSIDGVLASLISDFNTVSGQPGIRVLEGIQGIKELYEDILNAHQDILLIRSPDDDKYPELGVLVEEQIREQVRLGIKTRALTPLTEETPASVLKYDAKNLVTRRILPREHFATPAQIIIYGNTVAITSYEEPLMTTVIENKAIRDTHASLFEYIWKAAETEDRRIRTSIEATSSSRK